jgi:hypothetical protein
MSLTPTSLLHFQPQTTNQEGKKNMVLLATILKLRTQCSTTIIVVLHECKDKKPGCHPSRNLI